LHQERDQILAAIADRHISRDFPPGRSLPSSEVTVFINDALFSQMAEPAKRIPALELSLRQLPECLDSQLLQKILTFQLTPEPSPEPVFDIRQQRRSSLLDERGQSCRIAAANTLGEGVRSIVFHDCSLMLGDGSPSREPSASVFYHDSTPGDDALLSFCHGKFLHNTFKPTYPDVG
jgi:hypothetical protein